MHIDTDAVWGKKIFQNKQINTDATRRHGNHIKHVMHTRNTFSKTKDIIIRLVLKMGSRNCGYILSEPLDLCL